MCSKSLSLSYGLVIYCPSGFSDYVFDIYLTLFINIKIYFSIAISLIGGKFVLGKNAKVNEEEPWQKYLIPNVKSERLVYFNTLTKEVYLSAYPSKQSRFQAYLLGQRQFRWGVECSLEKLQNVVSSYKNGVILKENIDCLRCREFPENVKVEDVCKSQRALDNIKTTINNINKEKDKLLNRKKELYGDNLEPKKWASNEIAFV